MCDHTPSRDKVASRQLHELVRESAGPPGVRRSWAELIATLHGGIALLDDAGRITTVSDGFLAATGLDAELLVGSEPGDVFPHLADERRLPLLDRIRRGLVVGVGQRLVDSDGSLRWVRLTGSAVDEIGVGATAVLFVQDITATSHTMAARRRTTLRLTEVEEQELERLRRQLHDGPIQLLTALSWRLSLLGSPSLTHELTERLAEVSSEMHAVMVELGRDADLSAGEQLERWIAPLLSGTPLEVVIDDHLTERPSDELIHAAFVFLYELVRATRNLPMQRNQSMSIDHERGGYRLVITTTTGGSTLAGATAAQYRAMVEFARSLGGSLDSEDGHERTRTFSLWLPATAVATTDEARAKVATRRLSSFHPAEWVHLADRTIPPELDDAGWERLMNVAPEPLTELDGQLGWTFVNPAYEELEAAPSSDLTAGATVLTRFPDVVDALEPQIAKARQLEPVEFDLARRNSDGDLRYIRINASPRSDDGGAFSGAITVVEDLSNHYYLDGLQASAFDDLARARNQVRRASFDRLRSPLVTLEEIVDLVGDLAPFTPDCETMLHIREGLVDAIGRIRRSIDLLAVPDLADGDLGHAVRESVASLLVNDVRVEFVDELDSAMRADANETLFRIAREAVINAAVHGGSRRIEMRLREERDGVALLVRSDGDPVDPAAVEAPPGHIGVRLMIERAHAQGGTCTIEPDGQSGTVVRAWLPRREA